MHPPSLSTCWKFDFSALRAYILVATREKLNNDARFAVVARGPVTARIIQLLHLDDLLSLHETLEAALNAVKAGESQP